LQKAFRRELTAAEAAAWAEGEEGRRAAGVYLTRPVGHRNEVWEMDHKQLPILVMPPRGAACCPWLTTVIDDATRALAGWAIALTPHAGTVLTAVRMALVHDPARGPFGAIPARVRIDRGLEFAAEAVRDAFAATRTAARAGQAEPPRVTLRRHVQAAAARAEPEFFAALARREVQVRLRHSDRDPAEVTGYAVGLPGHLTPAGRQVWFGGGKLAPDLTLPKLRRRWPEPGRDGQRADVRERGRLHGHGMTDGAARAALRRETGRCAAAARSEAQFFAALDAAGLLIRLRDDPARPDRAAGYAVSLPGLVGRDGGQLWYGCRTLAPHLALGALRCRWQAGRTGAPPAAADFTGAEATDIFSYAAAAAAGAARQLRAAVGSDQAADIAWGAADVLTAAAEATGSIDLARAADSFSRAARAPWGGIPAPSPTGAGLRTAAYLLTTCIPARSRRRTDRLALVRALAGLAIAVAELRDAQRRLLQAAAARRAAADVAAAAAAGPDPAEVLARLAAADFVGPLVTVRPATARPGRARGPAARPRPARLPAPGRPGDTPDRAPITMRGIRHDVNHGKPAAQPRPAVRHSARGRHTGR
jgi:hypothetical protein